MSPAGRRPADWGDLPAAPRPTGDDVGPAPAAPAPEAPPTPRPRRAGPDAPGELRAALGGVSALLIDVDGVLTSRGLPIPGSGEAIDRLRERGIPFRLLTNTSLVSRRSLAERLGRIGIRVDPGSIVSCLSASAALAAARWAGRPLFVFATPEALTEFEGQLVLSDGEAAADGASVAAVIVGDAERGFTFDRLNLAFRLARSGARLVAMHRNAWWNAEDGLRLDSGAFVRALEFATGRRALIVGKPAPAFYRIAIASLGVPAGHIAMVGDDPVTDVGGAARIGLRTALVLTGRTSAADLRTPARGAAPPDAVAPSLAEVVAALD